MRESIFSQKYRTAILILSDTTKRGCGRISADLKDQFSLQQLPSYFQLTANRPSIVDLSISPLPTQVKKELLLNITSEIGVEIDEEEALMSICCGGEMLKGGKVKGDYAGYVKRTALKHIEYNRTIDDGADVIVIDSFDEAEHSKSNKKRTSLISFSSQVFTPEIINVGKVTLGSNLNIFTWQQLNGIESYSNMMPAVKDYFVEKGALYGAKNAISSLKNCRISYYDLHDGKMLYLLTQHSL